MPLIVTPMSDGRNWRLVEPFYYYIGKLGSDNIVTVPPGFITDFASTPQFLWLWLPYWGKYGKAAVVHDYLYQTQKRSRKEADQIFREAMVVGNTRAWKALVMFLAVRLFGWLSWKAKAWRLHGET